MGGRLESLTRSPMISVKNESSMLIVKAMPEYTTLREKISLKIDTWGFVSTSSCQR